MIPATQIAIEVLRNLKGINARINPGRNKYPRKSKLRII
jgi:hypothetical protein